MSRSYLCLGLWVAGSLCYALTAFLTYQYWLSPDDGLKSNSRSAPGVNSQQLDTPTYKQHNLDGSEPIWTIKLQHPLFEAPPVQDDPIRVEETRKLGIQLVGTAVDSSQKTAIFRLSSGDIQVKTVGESVGEAPTTAIVREIKEGTVVVEYAKELIKLRVQTKD